jgi:anti-anti-sigma regulatory factor
MLRIIRTDQLNAPLTVRLEGRLLIPWVEEVSIACQNPESVTLNLSRVTFADKAGVDLLRSLIAGGARIISCTSFIAELLERKGVR